MTVETFFEKFELFADAPGAVKRMRELVLHLAVTGKLGTQHPADEPAEELISRVAALRHSLGRKNYAPVAGHEAPYQLPRSWRWVRLGNISLKSDSGWSPQCLPEPRDGDNWGVLKVSAVSWGVFKPEENKALPISMEARPECEVQPGDFLLSRANTEDLVARSVVVDQVPPRLMMSDKIVRFTFPDEVDRHYVNLANTSVASRDYYARNASGTSSSMKNVGREVMCRLPIPLPPLAEQKRIVAKVGELTALCDQLETQQQEREIRQAALARASLARFAEAPTLANLQFLFHPSYSISPADLRESILTIAVQGKLVPQAPADQPAIENLDEIEAEKAELIESRKLRPNRVTEIPQTKELQYEVPNSWRWFRLGDIAFFQEGPGIRNWQFRAQGIKLLNVQNIVDGKLVLENTDRHISTEEFESTYRHFAVETGDILFASSGASWGKTAWFVDPGYTVMLNTSMVRLKFYSHKCDNAFLLLFLRTEFFKTQMEIQLVGIQPNFGSTHLGRVYIPLPPLAEQRRIVAKVEELMALVDVLEVKIATSRATAANLLSALVAELTSRNGGSYEA